MKKLTCLLTGVFVFCILCAATVQAEEIDRQVLIAKVRALHEQNSTGFDWVHFDGMSYIPSKGIGTAFYTVKTVQKDESGKTVEKEIFALVRLVKKSGAWFITKIVYQRTDKIFKYESQKI